MKNIIIGVVVVLVLLVGGFFWLNDYIYQEKQGDGAPAPAQSGKIDPRVACESALAYMSFADAASADIFVQECVEGKHPEVIERFIEESGHDGATI